jgi:hypothetical protein
MRGLEPVGLDLRLQPGRGRTLDDEQAGEHDDREGRERQSEQKEKHSGPPRP